MSKSDAFKRALTGNKRWCESIQAKDSAFLPNLSKGQAPKILWIGCSDSRVPETTICDLSPGEVFVHRNIANVVNATDLSSLSAVEFAVAKLKVEHIVVCGHSSCGGVTAALGNNKVGKIDTWLMPLRALRMKHASELAGLESDQARNARLVELNVMQGVEVLRENPDVRDAVRERGLQVHGVVFDLASGELKEVDCAELDQLEASRKTAFEVS